MEQPRISVVICAYTLARLNDIREAVASAFEQTLEPHEVIVAIDNNEELYNILQAELSPPARILLNQSSRGVSSTRSSGIAASTGELVACLDDDAVATVDWLENLVVPFRDSRVMSVGGTVVLLWPRPTPPRWFPEEFDFMIGGTQHKRLVTQPDGEIRNVNDPIISRNVQNPSAVLMLITKVAFRALSAGMAPY